MIRTSTFVKVYVHELIDLCRQNRSNPISSELLIGCQGLPNDAFVCVEEAAYSILKSHSDANLKDVFEKTTIKDINTGEEVEVNTITKKVEYT